MSEAQQIVASNYLGLAALHHLAIGVIVTLFWIRRRSMERPIAIYLALAFLTTAVALASHAPARAVAIIPAALCALWFIEFARPRNVFSFGRTPRLRIWLMGAATLFALMYPGYSGALPVFIFAPVGVILPPTLLLALAVMNAAAPETNRMLHWSLAAVGAVVGFVGLVMEGWIHVPLVATSLYAVPMLLGTAKLREEPDEVEATSVRAVHDRMHKRRVLLSRTRRTSARRLDVHKRRK